MNEREMQRRTFLQVLLSLPLGYAVGCAGDRATADQELLGRIVLALGPWQAEERARAEEFVGRFLVAEHLVGLYLPASTAAIRSLAGRLPDGAMSLTALDLTALSGEERELALQLAEQLYSLVEVRFLVSQEPPWGQCLGERTRYTQPPA